jgi:hypothetical protein
MSSNPQISQLNNTNSNPQSNKKENMYLKHIPNNTIYEVPSEHNVQITNKNSVTSMKEGKYLSIK